MYRRLRSFVGAHARELLLLLTRLRRRKGQPTLLVFPSQSREDGASNLRGYLIAEELSRMGWNATTCHKNIRLQQRLRLIRLLCPDVLLMQMARHPLNRPRLYNGVPVVFDMDDADYCDPEQRPHIIDALKDSAAVVAGSRAVASFCRQYNDEVHVVWTGTSISPVPPPPQADRPQIVSWAALYPSHCREEAEFLLDVLRLVKERTGEFQFLLYCDDGSEEYRAFSDRFRRLGIDVLTRPFITDYAEFLSSLEDVAVGLAPLVNVDGFSGGKSFGKVLAYMDRGVPIVTHPVVDHPLFFRSGVNAYMATSPQEWADVIVQLLASPAERQQIADAAYADLKARLSTREAAKRMDRILRRAIQNAS
jgi:glycosyltransferase involved in cell wall biosynthesis